MAEVNIGRATNVVLQANLSPIEHKVLVGFIEQAVDPDLAACEVLERIKRNASLPVEEVLRGFKKDWHRVVAMGR
jgi:hypothetical protein